MKLMNCEAFGEPCFDDPFVGLVSYQLHCQGVEAWKILGFCDAGTLHLRVKIFVDCCHVFAIVGKTSLSYHSS